MIAMKRQPKTSLKIKVQRNSQKVEIPLSYSYAYYCSSWLFKKSSDRNTGRDKCRQTESLSLNGEQPHMPDYI